MPSRRSSSRCSTRGSSPRRPANIVVFNGVRLLGPTRVIELQALVPAFAVVLAFIFLGEPIRPAQVVGGAIILAGVALTRRSPGRRDRPGVPAARDPRDRAGATGPATRAAGRRRWRSSSTTTGRSP